MLPNGLYKASFKTPNDSGDGVIYLQDGKAYGGDSAYYYTARYTVTGNKIVADFEFNQHSEGESVFGVDGGTMEITGVCDSKTAQLAAESIAGQFQVALTLLVPAKSLLPTG